MEPKPQITHPDFEVLDELDFNAGPEPEPRPKTGSAFKAGLIFFLVLFLGTVLLSNLHWFIPKKRGDSEGKKSLSLIGSLSMPEKSQVFYSPTEDTFTLLDATTGIAYVYDLQKDFLQRSINLHPDEIRHLDYSPDGKALALALDSGKISLRELVTGEEFNNFSSEDKALKVSWSPDGKTLAVVTADAHLKLLNLQTAVTTDLANDVIGSLAWSADSRFLVISVDQDPSRYIELARVFDLATLSELSFPALRDDRFSTARLLKGINTLIYGAAADQGVIAWDLANNQSYAFDPRYSWLGSSSISPDERLLLTSGPEKNEFVTWDLEDKILKTSFSYLSDTTYRLLWSPDSSQIAIADETHIDLVLAENGITSKRIAFNPNRTHNMLSFSPDNQLLLTTEGQTLSLWSAASGTLLHQVPSQQYPRNTQWLLNNTILLIEGDKSIDIYHLTSQPGGPASHISRNFPERILVRIKDRQRCFFIKTGYFA